MIEPARLRALFGLFDVQSRGSVHSTDFVKTVTNAIPTASLLDRLKSKVKKGSNRLLGALKEEFTDADIPYGSKGDIPISNF